MSTYWCQMQFPDNSNHSPPAPSNLICSTTQPVVNKTVINKQITMTAWLDLAILIATVLVVLIVAIWRYNVVNLSGYKSRRQLRLEHEEAMAKLEVDRLKAEAQRQQAIANQIYPSLPGEAVPMEATKGSKK